MTGQALGRSVIIDCDPGTDDAIALLLALASPELHVVAITVAGGNAPLTRTLTNARAIAGLAGARTPVYGGAASALKRPFPPGWAGHGENGLAGVVLPEGAAAAPGSAAEAIRSHLRATRRPVTLVGLAPATNLALALAGEPSLAPKIAEIVLLAGARGHGNATEAAEFNAWCDPEALAIVLEAAVPITLATIETAQDALATPERIAALRGRGDGRALRIAADILAALPPSRRFGGAGAAVYDPLVVAWLIRPTLFQTRRVRVAVDITSGSERGRTRIAIVRPTEPEARVRLLAAIEPDGFFALLGERLSHLP